MAIRQWTKFARCHVEHLHGRQVVVAVVGPFLEDDQQLAAVGRPRQRRGGLPGRRHRRQAAGSRGQPFRLAALRGHRPDMDRQGRLRGEIVVVADLESVIAFFDLFFVLRLVLGRESDRGAIGFPGKVLHAGRGIGDPQRVAAVHRQDVDLMVGGVARAARGHEGQAVPCWRPTRLADTAPFAGQDTMLARGHIHEYQLGVGAILLEVWPADDDGNRFAIRGQLRMAHAHELVDIIQLQSARRGRKFLVCRGCPADHGHEQDSGHEQASGR